MSMTIDDSSSLPPPHTHIPTHDLITFPSIDSSLTPSLGIHSRHSSTTSSLGTLSPMSVSSISHAHPTHLINSTLSSASDSDTPLTPHGNELASPMSIRPESPPYGLVSPINRISPRTPIQRSVTPKQDEIIPSMDGDKQSSQTSVSTPESKPAESTSESIPMVTDSTSTPSTKSATDGTSNTTSMDSDQSTSLLLPKTFNDLSLSSRPSTTSPRPPLSHSSHSTSHLEMRRHSHSHIRPHGHVRLSPRPHDDGNVYHMRHPSPPVMTRPLSQSHASRSHSGTPSSEGSPRTRRSDSPSSLSYSPISPISSSSSLQATARYSSRTHSGKTSRSRSTSPDTAQHHHRSTRQPITINAGTSSSPGQSPTISSPNLSARVRDGRRSHSSSPSQSPSLSPSPPLPKSIRIDCGTNDDHSTIEIESYRGRHHNDERSRDITNLSIDTTSEDMDSPRRHRHKFRINTSMVSPTTTFQKPTLNLQLATQSPVFRSLKPLHLESPSPNMSIVPHPNAAAVAAELENDSGSHLQARNKIEYFSRHCSEITDFLFVGGKKVAENYELLASKGITHIVNCAGDICDNYFPDKMTYKRMYLLDSASEDIICVMYPVFDFIDECRKKNGKALIHCQQGVSRSTVLCIAYLMYLNNKDYDDMYQMVRARRGVCRPNVGFMCQLLAWRKRVTGKNSKPKCLYRVAPHCSRDRHLVTKWVDRVDNSSLDARGLFVLHTPDALYIWIGSQCRRENEFMIEAQRLITKLQAIEHGSSTVYILRQTPDEKRELSDGQLWDDAPQAAGFWQVLGGNKILKTINPKFNEDYMEESAMKTMPTTTSTMMTQQPVTITTGHGVARASPRRSGPPVTPKSMSTSPQSHMMTKPETPKALSLNSVTSPTSRPVVTRDRSAPNHGGSMITVPGQRPKARTGVPAKSMSVVMTQPPLGHKIVQGHRSMKSTPMGLMSMGSPPHQHHSQHSYIHHSHPHTISPSSPMHHAQHTPSRSRAGSGTRRDSVSGATPPNLSLNLAPSMMTSAPGSARKDGHTHSHPHPAPHAPTHPHEGTSMSGLSYSADEDTDTTDTNDTDTDTDLFHRRGTSKMSMLPLGDIDHTTDDGEYADAENSGNDEEDVSMEEEESECEDEIDGDQERRNSKSLKRRSHALKSDRTSHSMKRTSPTTTATVHHKSPVLRGVSKSPQPMSSRTSGVKLKLNTMITDDFGTRRRSSSSGQHGSQSHRRNYDEEKHHHHHVHPINEHEPTTHDYFDPQGGMSSHRHYTHTHHQPSHTQTSHPQARGKPRAMSAVSPSSAQRAIIAMQLHAPNASSRSSSRSPVPRSPHHSSNVTSPSHPHMQPASSPQPRPSLSRPGSSSSGHDGSARGPHRGSLRRVVTSPNTNGIDDGDVHSSGDEYDTPQYRVMPIHTSPMRRPSQDHDGDLSDSSTGTGEKAILYDYPACTPVEMFDSDDLIPDQIFVLCFRPTKIPSAITTPVANPNNTTPSSPSLLAPPTSTSSVELHVWLGEDVVIPESYQDVRSYATHIAQDFVQRQHITVPYSVTAQESGHETERFWDGFADG